MTPAIFSIIGLAIGAALQYLFSRHLDNQKHRREVRTAAYIDYLKCVCEHANLGKQRQSLEGRELAAKTAEAKCRISLYGSSLTVEAFANFERLGATMNSPEQCRAFTGMVSLMRSDSIGGKVVALDDLETVLLGTNA